MTPLFVQVLVTVLARMFTSWREAARIGIAAMFIFTGASHFSTLKYDMAAMIPPPFTGSLELIYLTGIVEIVGAAALLMHRWRRPAAWSLAALLVTLFPANVYAVLTNVTLGGQSATPLWFRGPLQLFWFAILLWVARRKEASVMPDKSKRRVEWLAYRDGVM
jgi:uncharacterized membrane protein